MEHDADEISRVTFKAITEAIRGAGSHSGKIRSIDITNQHETVVIWNRDTGHATSVERD